MILLNRLDARDRALYERIVLPHDTPLRWRTLFMTLTHLGGARATIGAALMPFGLGVEWRDIAMHGTLTLVLSHLLVQVAKRMVHRDRPSRSGGGRPFLVEPDRFSFPSGHATASMAVALAFAAASPSLAAPLLLLAILIGVSRVALGVHYPGDVLAGQGLAIATHIALVALGQ